MFRVALPALGFTGGWRDAARRLASHRTPPEMVEWVRDGDGGHSGHSGATTPGLFDADPVPAQGPHPVTAPRELVGLLDSALCHRADEAPALAYALLLRHQNDRRAAFNPADPLTRRVQALVKNVGRDIHKMHAFVRFREMDAQGLRRSFGAWFEPDHLILEAATPFFARRFGDMDWIIATPQGVARFDGGLSFHPPGPRPDLPDDAAETLWGTYFANIFNPARVKTATMRSQMPLKYWKNLPETRLIPEMLAGAEVRVAAMRDALPSTPPVRAVRILDRQTAPPDDAPETLADVARQARHCTRCTLCEAATQTVWGEGDPTAPLMLVGEQPGDAEDLAGRPFVGPAGQLLHEVMGAAGVGPVWLANAVKHFKFRPRGKLRLHQNPNRDEITHCRWWLGLERRFIAPKLTVALGASAAFALTGDAGALTPRRGGVEGALDGGPVLVTWHPSLILRLSGDAAAQARAQLQADLARAAAMVA